MAERGGWRAAWPGLCATLVGVGIGRFSYTPLIPFLIADGVLSETEAAYLGAASVLGYLLGASVAARTVSRIGMAKSVRLPVLPAALSLAACGPPPGVLWFLA